MLLPKKWYRPRLLRADDVARVLFVRDVEANTPWDAIAMVEQMAVVAHPGDVYEYDGCDRIWTPRPPVEVEGVPS